MKYKPHIEKDHQKGLRRISYCGYMAAMLFYAPCSYSELRFDYDIKRFQYL